MNKAFSNFTWENEPSENTAVNAENLNKINNALDTVDSRVVTHETTKLDKTTANTMVKDVAFDSASGIFTITKLNGSVLKIDTKLEKLAVNFSYDKNTQILSIILDDGTTQEVDLSALITQYEFAESDTIILTVGTDGKVVANIKSGSITGEMLEPNYLANVTIQANNAASSANTAKTQADRSESEADRAEEAAKEAKAATGLYIDDSLSGTSVNPVQNKVVKSAIDSIQTTSSGTLSEAGWYRVAEYAPSDANYLLGVTGNGCVLKINKVQYNGNSEDYTVRLQTKTNNQEFKIENSIITSTQYLTKLRYTSDGTKDYIEVYYSLDNNNPINVAVNSYKDYRKGIWQAITPTLTSEEVDGVTVTTTYDIPANASPVTDLDLETHVYSSLIVASEDDFYTQVNKLHESVAESASYERRIYFSYSDSIFGGGRAVIRGFKQNSDNGHQIIEKRKSTSESIIAIRSISGGAWQDWDVFVTTSVLAAELAKYLPLDGSKDLTNFLRIGTSNDSDVHSVILRNALRTGRFQLDEYGNITLLADGEVILKSATDGTNTFNGIAAENLALDGSNAANVIKIKTADDSKFNGDVVFDTTTKNLRIIEKDSPYRGVVLDITECDSQSRLLHTGNSAAVVISDTAPSDTNALWYDTINKALKRYVDGAWQQ